MHGISGPSPRAWAAIALPVTAALVALAAHRGMPDDPTGRLHVVPGVLKDAALPRGGTASLSGCGARGPVRPAPRGEGEQAPAPALVLTSYGYSSSGPRFDGPPAFTVSAVIDPGPRPLTLTAPVGERRITVDVYGPHGEGRIASARGLTAKVTKGAKQRPVPPTSGAYRFTDIGNLDLEIELPERAVCPGHTRADIGQCAPDHTNQIEDCPVVAVTLTDEAVSAQRALAAGIKNPKRFSDRLVAVSFEENAAGV
ncbi:hypothetical protein ABZT43_08405 [Streptomyces sp. NPDC005349]|uniref:hypothetical protein n=1 Tax=Streptomyces sp. NPDC005349 TaxID=3157037 RepID=UPI0033A70705